MKAAGVQWVIVDVTSPYSSWEVQRLQLVLKQAHTRGIKVLGWLGPLTVGNKEFTLEEWNEAVRAVASIHSTMDAWQIWNEPNLPRFYLGYMDGTPEHYVDMLKSAYEIIKASQPVPAPVIAGSLSPQAGLVQWVNSCWQLGAAKYCDIWGVHLYDVIQDWMLKEITSITSPKPIWITESGVDSLRYGLEGQATKLAELDAYFKENAANYRIENVFWYCYMDYAMEGADKNVFGTPTSSSDFFGLVTVNLNPKPAYDMYKSLAPPPTPPTPPIIPILFIGGLLYLLTRRR
jgi:hypothetical protein